MWDWSVIMIQDKKGEKREKKHVCNTTEEVTKMR